MPDTVTTTNAKPGDPIFTENAKLRSLLLEVKSKCKGMGCEVAGMWDRIEADGREEGINGD